MGTNDFLEKTVKANENYFGKINSLTFIVRRGKEEKKIFKWLFEPNDVNFYVTFPYFHSDKFYCGTVEIPENLTDNELFDAVKHGTPSSEPVKFSYHKDGNVHFKQSNFAATAPNKGEKLASLTAKPITELEGGSLFTIRFEGLEKFQDLEKHKSKNGDQEVILDVSEDIINFEVQAFAGTSEKSLESQISPGSVPWFQVSGRTSEGQPVFIGVYAILSKRSHILDENKNALAVLVGFDRSDLTETGKVKSLYLFAR